MSELVFRIGSHTLSGKHSQPTRLGWVKGIHVCLGVNWHLHFWQNDQGLFCDSRRWNRHRRREGRKFNLKKKLFLLLLPGLELTTFQSWVQHSTSKLSWLPFIIYKTNQLLNYSTTKSINQMKISTPRLCVLQTVSSPVWCNPGDHWTFWSSAEWLDSLSENKHLFCLSISAFK